jgi:hypothetical protein
MTIDILQNFLVFLNNQKRNVEDLYPKQFNFIIIFG